ncbi:hypothetical protein FVEN_g9240 [Fusarium venenatum]|uniref:Asl1-like glycosyl hydrolase catalytic domain-containing protein n=1 Tax=Fusarium venenatum TaxID=56646 RepID=A0A2L2THR7_9HYPO|nr:uncharacterized protein FVRRES_00459 [Fusarium venenatum]KAG8352891.1 hypothetical protein FVEN_g9240 [Fusarium venenatum]KAH7006296.1 glycosyl hydrolase catalytic core-domain-containing protein [Fusarium venenatum]CEI63947.1 unnamed protein product [Fusarium venenatum]
MIANKLTVLAATAALLEPALALGHRHGRHQHKRDQVVATIDGQVVSWENNYFPGGAAPAATQAASQPEAPAAPAPAAAKPTTVIKVAKPSQAAKSAYEAPKAEEKAAAPKKIEQVQQVKQVKAASTPKKVKAASASSGGSAGFSHKRGVCYNNVKLANTFASNCENCGWGYNWDSESGGLDSGLNFIPTLWSDDAVHVDRFASNCAKSLANGAKAIFSFNEPDNGGQAHMTPAAAAAAHIKLLNPYAGKALIGAPSISNSGLPMEGREWLENFVKECGDDCHYDFCNVHWYSEVEYGETLFEHLEKSHEICGGKPIWLTEFAPKGSDEAIASWLEEAIPRLEALDYLDAYSYFKVETGMLMTSETEMSKYGSVYASA